MAKGKDKIITSAMRKDPRLSYLDREENALYRQMYEAQRDHLERMTKAEMQKAAEEMGLTLDEYKAQQRQYLDDLLRMAEEHAKAMDKRYKETGSSYEENKRWEEARQAKAKANAEKRASKTYDPGWLDKYLGKKGHSLSTLEKSVMNMSKEEILKRFPDFGMTSVQSKNEMLSIILDTLLKRGYKY